METSPRAALVRAIADRLAQGLAQDAATAHCLAASLGELPPAELAARLGDPDDLEAAPLRELVLFPGRGLLRALEPALTAADLDDAGQTALVRELAGAVRETAIALPDGPTLRLPLAASDLHIFVVRLRPTATPPLAVREALCRRFAPATALDLAVDCRQSGLAWTPPRRGFLTTLLARPLPEADAPAVIHYALRFLGELRPDEPPLAALPRRREVLAQHYHRACLQEQSLARSNFETLLLTGARLPHLHAPDLAQEIGWLDAILLALTGRTGESQTPSQRELGTLADVDDLLEALGKIDG